MARRFAAFVACQTGDDDVRVLDLDRLYGGGSKSTWGARVEYRVDGRGDRVARDVVIRMDQDASLVESDLHVEITFYRAFLDVAGVPVPEVLWVEDDPSVLGAPFFVMTRLWGSALPEELLGPEYEEGRPAIARDMMEILGRIAAADPSELGLDRALPKTTPEDAWRAQVDDWERVLDEHDVGPLPVTRAAIRHLRRNPPPPPARLSVVHGDFRVGNVFYGRDRVEGVLDWEMAHLGDPHEDLAWAMAPNWEFGEPGLVGGLLTRERACEHWARGSGLEVDAEALGWWSLFVHVKLMGIWATAGYGRSYRYVGVLWNAIDREELWMLDALEAAS